MVIKLISGLWKKVSNRERNKQSDIQTGCKQTPRLVKLIWKKKKTKAGENNKQMELI